MRAMFFSLFCLFMAGCASSAAQMAAPDIEYDSPMLGHYDSHAGTLTALQCGKPASVAVVVGERRLRAIAHVAESNGFFDLPHELKAAQPEDKPPAFGEIKPLVKPKACKACPGYRIKITDGTQVNEVQWDCGCGDSLPPAPVADLVLALNGALYDSPAVTAMQSAVCPAN